MKYSILGILFIVIFIFLSMTPTNKSIAQNPDQLGMGNIRTITVTGDAEVRVQPDEAYIAFSVQTYDKKLERAKLENDLELSRIRSIIESFDVDTAYIQIDYIRFQPDYEGWRTDRIDKYGINKSLNFALRDINTLDTLLTLLINKSSIRNLEVELGVRDITRYEDQARTNAIKAAKAKAEIMAFQLDLKLGRVYSVAENRPEEYEYDWPYPRKSYSRSGRGGLSLSAMSLLGGAEPYTAHSSKIAVTSSVTIIFELE